MNRKCADIPAGCQEQTLRRIAVVMSTSIETVVKPLKLFVEETLQKPLILHEVPRMSLSALTTLVKCAERRPGGRVDLSDILTTVKDALDTHLPFPWMAFCSDVGVAYASFGHFVEHTQEAGAWGLGFLSFFHAAPRPICCILMTMTMTMTKF